MSDQSPDQQRPAGPVGPDDVTAPLPSVPPPPPAAPSPGPSWSAGLSRVVLGLAGAVLLLLGFAVGMLVGNSTAGAASADDDRPSRGEGFGFGAGPGGFGGHDRDSPGPGMGMGMDWDGFGGAVGTITSIDGDTVTLETPSGESVEVETGDDTDVTVTTEGSVGDLSEGDTVLVTGDRGDDDTIDADMIHAGIGLPGQDDNRTS